MKSSDHAVLRAHHRAPIHIQAQFAPVNASSVVSANKDF
jgi:hypothetical protein